MDPNGEWCKFVAAEAEKIQYGACSFNNGFRAGVAGRENKILRRVEEAYEKGVKKGQEIKFEISTAKARTQGAQEERKELLADLSVIPYDALTNKGIFKAMDLVNQRSRGEGKPECTCGYGVVPRGPAHAPSCLCYEPPDPVLGNGIYHDYGWWERELPDNPRKIARLGHIDSGDIWDIQARLNELIDRENSRA
jgi:hypothetical protein